jgi:hypothetical protein
VNNTNRIDKSSITNAECTITAFQADEYRGCFLKFRVASYVLVIPKRRLLHPALKAGFGGRFFHAIAFKNHGGTKYDTDK